MAKTGALTAYLVLLAKGEGAPRRCCCRHAQEHLLRVSRFTSVGRGLLRLQESLMRPNL